MCRYDLPPNYQLTVNRALHAKIARVLRKTGSSEEIDYTVNSCFDSIFEEYSRRADAYMSKLELMQFLKNTNSDVFTLGPG